MMVQSGSRLADWAALVRLPGLPSAWSNIVAAHLIATGGAPVAPLLELQLAMTTCLYWGGMILNDCFDHEEDRAERPERPLPAGRIQTSSAWSVGFALLLFGVILGLVAGGATAIIGILLAATVLAYNGGLKRGPAGPWAMGLCRFFNWLLGLSAAESLWPSLTIALPVLLYTASLTMLSRGEVRGDRRGEVILATLVLLSATWTLLALLYLSGIQEPIPAGFLLIALSIALIVRLRWVARNPTPQGIQATVRALLIGMIPLDALLLLGAGQPTNSVLLLFLVIPGVIMARAIRLT